MVLKYSESICFWVARKAVLHWQIWRSVQASQSSDSRSSSISMKLLMNYFLRSSTDVGCSFLQAVTCWSMIITLWRASLASSCRQCILFAYSLISRSLMVRVPFVVFPPPLPAMMLLLIPIFYILNRTHDQVDTKHTRMNNDSPQQIKHALESWIWLLGLHFFYHLFCLLHFILQLSFLLLLGVQLDLELLVVPHQDVILLLQVVLLEQSVVEVTDEGLELSGKRLLGHSGQRGRRHACPYYLLRWGFCDGRWRNSPWCGEGRDSFYWGRVGFGQHFGRSGRGQGRDRLLGGRVGEDLLAFRGRGGLGGFSGSVGGQLHIIYYPTQFQAAVHNSLGLAERLLLVKELLRIQVTIC